MSQTETAPRSYLWRLPWDRVLQIGLPVSTGMPPTPIDQVPFRRAVGRPMAPFALEPAGRGEDHVNCWWRLPGDVLFGCPACQFSEIHLHSPMSRRLGVAVQVLLEAATSTPPAATADPVDQFRPRQVLPANGHHIPALINEFTG